MLVMGLTGCESDTSKLERLRSDEAVHQLAVMMYQQRIDSLTKLAPNDSAGLRVATTAKLAHEDSLLIVQRDISRLTR